MITCSVIVWPENQTCHQPIWEEQELAQILKENPADILNGPDTCLLHYQIARSKKDWDRADEIVARAKELGYNLSFQKNYYSAHYI